MIEKKHCTVIMPATLARDVRVVAAKNDKSFSWAMRAALRLWLENQNKNNGADNGRQE